MTTLVVLGNAGRDTTYRLDRLPRAGETLNARSVSGDLGGKGLNQAIAARRAGAAVRLIAPVGDDDIARAVRSRLAAEGISAEDLIEGAGRSDHSTLLVDSGGENMIVSDSARASSLRADVALPRLQLAAGDALMMQGNLSAETTRAAAEAARAAGALVIFNPAPFDPAFVAMAPLVDLLILNAGEATAFAGADDPSLWPGRLQAPHAIVTLGAEGCLVIRTGDGPLRIEAPAVEAVDTVGAGDVFVGTFAAEWMQGSDAERAARLAVLAASAKVTRSGTVTAFPTGDEIQHLRSSL